MGVVAATVTVTNIRDEKRVNHGLLLSRLAVLAALGTCCACSARNGPNADGAQAERVPIEPIPTEEGVKPLEHQALPPPENPEVRFKKLSTIQGTPGHGLIFLAFSPDGKILAAGRWGGPGDPDVRLWNVATRRLFHVLPHGNGTGGEITGIGFLPPSDRLITGCLALNEVFLWDVGTGKLLETLDLGHESLHGAIALAGFPDGKRVICCAYSGLILWDLEAKTHKSVCNRSHPGEQ